MKLIAPNKLFIAGMFILGVCLTSCGNNTTSEAKQDTINNLRTDTLPEPLDSGDTRGVKTPVKD